MTQEEYIELIERYLVEESTEEESKELIELISSRDEIKATYLKMKRVIELSETNEIVKQLDAQAEFEKFKKTRSLKESKVIQMPSGMKTIRIILRAAAVIALGGLLWMIGIKEPNPTIMVAEASSESSLEKALADGSQITINTNSVLSYPEVFDENIRLVRLEGEAFFDIESNKDKPFVIEVGDQRVMVTGTQFNVNANNIDSIVVTVKKGSVLFYNKNDEVESISKTNLLTAEMKGTKLASNSNFLFSNNENINYLFWQDGQIKFRDSPLQDIVALLNSKWELNLELKNANKNTCKLTVSFDNKDISYILQLLELTLDITVEEEGDKIIIDGQGC
ncbi:MAG: FecR domain-containing protein [Flavobacteriales bacterium]|nr:FecR domain-containing protein [Flavobacteriales bacterium]